MKNVVPSGRWDWLLAIVLPPRSPAATEERRRAVNYPVSRWYLRPLAGALAAWLSDSRARPIHLTLAGLASACAAGALIGLYPSGSWLAGCLVLLAWFFDRADGQLARRQDTATAFGAWLDANVDELVDIGWHVAIAAGAAAGTFSTWPWLALTAFLAGKYLFMYSLTTEEWQFGANASLARLGREDREDGPRATTRKQPARRKSLEPSRRDSGSEIRFLRLSDRYRWLYHLPANADVRLHALAFAVTFGLGGVELVLFAAYYNLRWIVRHVLVARRLADQLSSPILLPLLPKADRDEAASPDTSEPALPRRGRTVRRRGGAA